MEQKIKYLISISFVIIATILFVSIISVQAANQNLERQNHRGSSDYSSKVTSSERNEPDNQVRPANQMLSFNGNSMITSSEVNLMNEWRKLWEDHVTWTRLFIISDVSNLSDKSQALNRLLKNYNDMEDALKDYYPNDDAESVGDLLQAHLTIAAKLVDDAKSGNNTAVTADENLWFSNADQIAHKLSQLNPNWNEQEMKNMWHQHLTVTEREAVDRISGNYNDDVTNYDAIHDKALEMADSFSQGIIMQFPNRFL